MPEEEEGEEEEEEEEWEEEEWWKFRQIWAFFDFSMPKILNNIYAFFQTAYL